MSYPKERSGPECLCVSVLYVIFYHKADTLIQLISDGETHRVCCQTIAPKLKECDFEQNEFTHQLIFSSGENPGS